MTNQEAAEYIKERCFTDYPNITDDSKWDQAMVAAISSLEKQIPVKATFDSDMDYVECPVCCQLTNANGFPEDINYCYHCGQAFDWEGEE